MGTGNARSVDAASAVPNHGGWILRERDSPMQRAVGVWKMGRISQRRPHARLRSRSREIAQLTLAATLMLLAAGCHHRTQQTYAPPPPPIRSDRSQRSSNGSISGSSPDTATNTGTLERSQRGPVTQPAGKPILVETGMASWYGPSGHRTADGSAYNGSGMTAAHKTLPLGTVARVTNLVNGESVMVRITDRGPFAHGRVLDLSESAAKEIGLYRMGVAKVKIEAYANATASSGGRWCVQTGAFKSQKDALDLKSALTRRYTGSRVIEFAGATGYWVRIDPARHDHADAAAIMDWIGNPDAQTVSYVVRID